MTECVLPTSVRKLRKGDWILDGVTRRRILMKPMWVKEWRVHVTGAVLTFPTKTAYTLKLVER